MTTRKAKSPDFEQALSDLEGVVERLEHGDLPLEEALKQAEQKVEILLKKTDDAEPQAFEPEE